MQIFCCSMLILAAAMPNADIPTGPSPSLLFVRGDGNGGLEQTVTVTRYVQVEVEKEVNVNGVVQKIKTLEKVPTMQSSIRRIDAKSFEFYDLEGKKVDDAGWQKAVKDGVVVAKSENSDVPHPAYRKALKAGTLILVLKPTAKPALK